MKATTVTFSQKLCDHKNGWFKTIYFKKWFFEFRKTYFLCSDCNDLIPKEHLQTKQK